MKKQRQDEGADCPCRIKASPARTPELRDRVDFQQRGIASALRMCPLLGGVSKIFGCGSAAACPAIEEVGPVHILNTEFDGERSVGTRF